jgi:hypothetical protein
MVMQVDIQKRLGTEYWTNVYYVTNASYEGAIAAGLDIVEVERNLHQQQVAFVNMRVRPYPAGGAEGAVYELSTFGLITNEQYLPLFNTLNVKMTVVPGRPSRKYYRCPIAESWQASGVLDTGQVAAFNTILEDLLAVATLCDESGNPFTAIRCYPLVGMRQLRRGSKRRAVPVI